MGCCSSRGRSTDKENSLVAPKNKLHVSGKRSAANSAPLNSDPRSHSSSPNEQAHGLTAEDEELEKRIAQRDRLEEQRKQSELERLKERGGFISYHQSPSGASVLPEEPEKPILELKVLPHGVENPKHIINTPPTELIQVKPKNLPKEEDNTTFSEAEEEVTAGVKSTVVPPSEYLSVSAAHLKDNGTEKTLDSATPLPEEDGVFIQLGKENSESRANDDKMGTNQSKNSRENNSTVVPESKHEDPVKETQSPSPNVIGKPCNILDEIPKDVVRGWSTAIIEDVQSPSDRQRRFSLSMEDFPDTSSDCTTQNFSTSKIIMKKLPPPPTPDHKEESGKQALQVRNDETEKTQEVGSGVITTKEKTPHSFEDPKSSRIRSQEGVELADIAVLNSEIDDSQAERLDQVAVVLPLEREKGDVVSDMKKSRSRGEDDPIPFLSLTGEKSAQSAGSTSEFEDRQTMLQHVSGTEKYTTPTDVPNLGISAQTHEQLHQIKGEDAPLLGPPMNGVGVISANSSTGGKQRKMGLHDHHADVNDADSLSNNHVSSGAPKAGLVETGLYTMSHSTDSESSGRVENSAWMSLPEADADMISKGTPNGKEQSEARRSVETNQSSEVQPFFLRPSAVSLPVMDEGINFIDTYGIQQTPDRKPELNSDSSITAITAAAGAGAVPPRRWPLNPPLPSPINTTNIDADDSNESRLRKKTY